MNKQMPWLRTFLIAALVLGLGTTVASAESVKKTKATSYQIYYAAASSPDEAFQLCAKKLGAKNCLAPHGGCNFYDWQWGAIAAGARPNFAVQSASTVHHKSANAAKAAALERCNRVARESGYSCSIVHVWAKGCGYISVGCAGVGCPRPNSE